MKIVNSTVDMVSSYSFEQQSQRSEQLTVWVGDDSNVSAENNTSAGSFPEAAQGYILELSDQAKAAQQNQTVQNTTAAPKTAEPGELELSDRDKLKIHLVEKMIEMLTGKKIKIKIPNLNKELAGRDELAKLQKELRQELRNQIQGQVPSKEGWGLTYNYQESIYEREQLSFSAEGVIKTADGREIKIDIELNMTREFAQQTNLSIRAGDAVKVDPLVINYSGQAAELTETKFSFDLDVDGQNEQISFLQSGSGFLALDTNDDGIINNGSELFGPNSVNGFAALAQYDDDQNNWIDENDAVFNRLKIWTKDAQGKDNLLAVGQQGIGAIYLGYTDTQFAFQDTQHTLQGELKQTGVFLKEDGAAGLVQQIDLAI